MSTTTPSAQPRPTETTRPTWVRWHIVALLVSYSFMTWFNRVSMSVAYDEQIKTQTGMSPEAIGSVISAFLFAYMICMTPGGWLIDRFGPWAALVVMGLGSALFGALTGIAGLPALMAPQMPHRPSAETAARSQGSVIRSRAVVSAPRTAPIPESRRFSRKASDRSTRRPFSM